MRQYKTEAKLLVEKFGLLAIPHVEGILDNINLMSESIKDPQFILWVGYWEAVLKEIEKL